MSNGSKLTDNDRANILVDWSNGVSGEVMAAKYNVHPSYPRVLAQRAGYAPRKKIFNAPYRLYRRGPKLPGQEIGPRPFVGARVDVMRVRELQRRGLGLTSIAAMMRARYADVHEALSV